MRKLLIVLSLIGIFAGGILLPGPHRDMQEKPRQYRGHMDRMLDLIGELRTPLAMMMFYRMDLYHELLAQQGTSYTKETQLMPLLRLTTYLDPKLDEAYDLLSFDLIRGHGRQDEAMKILEEGLVYNPDSFVLNSRMGQLLLWRREYRKAIPYLQRALNHPREEQGALDAYNMLALLYHAHGGLREVPLQQQIINVMRKTLPGMGRTEIFQKEIDEGRSAKDVVAPHGQDPLEDLHED